MEFRSAFFAIIAVSMVMIAVGVIINGWAVPYNSGLISDLGDYDKLSDTSDTSGTQQGRINPQSGEASSDFETETFRGGYGILTNIYSSFRVVFGDGGMIDAVTERFGLPDYLRQGIITMMILAITLSIIAVIFRLGRTSI